jgi:protein-S-isoprenylcysteine O-methyltransferase Ste14
MEYLLKLYLPLFFIGFVLLAFVRPSIRVYRQTGINPFRFATHHDEAHDYIGKLLKVFILVLLLAVCCYSFFPAAYALLAPFGYLERPGIRLAGLITGHLALPGILIAQRQMKQSWRIGIDYINKTELISSGLFAWSRNPIYVFLLAALTGLFFVIPNAITFAVVCGAYIILQIIMRMEEAFLLKQHGKRYESYRAKVKRLL